MRPSTIAGYRLALGQGLAAALHSDGALSLEDGQGRALDLAPDQVDQLAALLRLGGQLRSQARRRRARQDYTATYGES